MGKPELPHPKHRPAGTSTQPGRVNEELRDTDPVGFANQRAREALEDRKIEQLADEPLEEPDDATLERIAKEEAQRLESEPIPGDVLGSGADDTNSGRCVHGVGFDEPCEQCEEGPEL